MKKLFSVLIAAVMLLTCFAAAEAIQPETRESVIMLEGIEETITETLHADEAGYSIWYQAELFALEAADGQAHFFAIDSTAEGEEPGLLTSDSYLLVVPVEITQEEIDAFLMEATGGFDPEAATIGEVFRETLENGAELSRVSVFDETTAYSYYIVTNGDIVLCVSAICPLEAMEGWGARFDHMVKTIGF